MKVGCLEKNLDFQLEPVAKGIYNLYVPGSLDLKAIKDMLRNPPEDCNYLIIYDAKNQDRYKNIIERVSKEFPELHYYRFDNDGNVHYIVDFKDTMPEEYR